MYKSQRQHELFLEADRQLVDVFKEINELRRSRCLPEYQPRTTTFGVLPRQPCRRLRARSARAR